MKISDLQIQNDGEIHEDPDALNPADPMLPVEEYEARGMNDGLPADFPAGAMRQPDGSIVLKLKYPAVLKLRSADGSVREEVTRSLHLNRLKGKHQNEIRRADAEDRPIQMIACSAGMTLAKMQLVHDAMDTADIAAALRVVYFFMTPGRRTGQ